jgi:hypothetical protein
MADDIDNENEFERDFSEDSAAEETINDDVTSEVASEEPKENLNPADEENFNPVDEANESLITMDPAPFDKTLKNISQTLSSIDNKMDLESLQLQKLDQLDQLTEIKDQLNRIENSDIIKDDTKNNDFKESDLAIENGASQNDNGEEINQQNNIGHNQQEVSELLEKVADLEKKLIDIESQSNNFKEKIESIENVVERFEDLESEILVEYEDEETGFFKNLFKKKDNSKPYNNKSEKDSIDLQLKDNVDLQLREIEIPIPKNTENIIEEAERISDNVSNTINEEKFTEKKEKVKTNPNILKYGLGMLVLLLLTLSLLFLFDKYQIIDLSFYKVIDSTIISLF